MRFLHTADWHIGRLFFGIHLTEDQSFVLRQFVDLVADTRPDAVVIAGDIYDRAVPPPDAVGLLDDTLSQLVMDARVPVLVIAGNHDSPDRLGFGSRLLAEQGLHVVASPTSEPGCVTLEDKHGPVSFFLLPYAEPALARERYDDLSIVDHQTAMDAAVESIDARHSRRDRSVLVAHTFVNGGVETESERPLSIGGVATVNAQTFQHFDYVALGHLHRAQTIESETVQYSGSPLKYSFSEATHHKSVNLVELDAAGACTVERIPLPPRRDVRCVAGLFEDLLRGPGDGESCDDYLLIRLEDREPIFDAMGRLRGVYPNALHIERPCLSHSPDDPGLTARDREVDNESRLFSSFFSQVTGETLSSRQAEAFDTVVTDINREDRESSS